MDAVNKYGPVLAILCIIGGFSNILYEHFISGTFLIIMALLISYEVVRDIK